MRIKELDGLRAIAIFSVFLLHFESGRLATSFGWAGVDLFFVISGFLITAILLNLRTDKHPYRTFYWRRFIRISPPYYAVLAIIALLVLVRRESFDSVWWSRVLFFLPELRTGISFHLIFQRLMGRVPFDWGHELIVGLGSTNTALTVPTIGSGIFVYWSLCVEELFYLFWAPVVLGCSRRIISVVAIASLILCPACRALTHTADFSEYFGFITRFDALAAGACVALLLTSNAKISKPNAKISKWILIPIPVCAVALVGLSIHVGVLRGIDARSTELFSAVGYSLFAVMFACIVAACVLWQGHPWLAPLRIKPVVYLGTISYMMYLIHLTVYALLFSVVPNSTLRGIAAALVTIGIGALSWQYFESPILRLRNWRRPIAVKASPGIVKVSAPSQTQ